MDQTRCLPRVAIGIAITMLVVFTLSNLALAQSFQQVPKWQATAAASPFSLPPYGTPSSPSGLPGSAHGGLLGSDAVTLSDAMFRNFLRTIPNLQLGYSYSFGNNVRQGSFIGDYTLPINLRASSVIFGEAHAEFQSFRQTPSVSVPVVPGSTPTKSGAESRVDLSFGGGYREVFNDVLLLGVNGFYDTSRLFGDWYSSGGFGLQMMTNTFGSAFDLNFNWYDSLFGLDGFVNAFRNKGGSFDLEAGYYQGIFNDTFDLRLKLAGYQFEAVDKVYGLRTGAELTTRDGVFSAKYDYGHDGLNGTYQSIGGYLNVGLQLDNLLSWQSPFCAPSPVFKSPRNLSRWLGRPVSRNWHQPSSVVLAKQIRNREGPATRRLVLIGINSVFPPGGGTFTADPLNNRWSFTGIGIMGVLALSYDVEVSDGSLTTLQGLIAPPASGHIALNSWSLSGLQLAGPTPMLVSPVNTYMNVAWGPFWGAHNVTCTPGGPTIGTVVISSTDPSIEPLTINYTIGP